LSVTPARVCSASARFLSGNFVTSSAVIASTTATSSRLVSSEPGSSSECP
jgi:hypothetical protein